MSALYCASYIYYPGNFYVVFIPLYLFANFPFCFIPCACNVDRMFTSLDSVFGEEFIMEPIGSCTEIEPRSFIDFYKTAQMANSQTGGSPQPLFINFRPCKVRFNYFLSWYLFPFFQNSSKCRIYFASFTSGYGNINIFYADVDISDKAKSQINLNLQPLLQKEAFNTITQ